MSPRPGLPTEVRAKIRELLTSGLNAVQVRDFLMSQGPDSIEVSLPVINGEARELGLVADVGRPPSPYLSRARELEELGYSRSGIASLITQEYRLARPMTRANISKILRSKK